MTTTFDVQNATQIDADGTVQMTLMVLEDGVLTQSFPMVVQPQGVRELAFEFAKTWVTDNPSQIATYTSPTIEVVRDNGLRQLAFELGALPQSILRKYPEAERELWPDYEREALLYTSSAGANVATDYPALLGMLEVKLGAAADDAERTTRMDAAVPGILTNATNWRAIALYISGARARIGAQIEGAADEAACQTILAAAQVEFAQVKAQFGL